MAKILVVIARLNVGGTSQYIGEFTKQISKHGHEVLIATGYVQGAEKEDSVVDEIPIVRVEYLGRKVSLFKDLRARNNLKQVVKEFRPDIVYSHTFKAGVLSRTIKLRVPLIHAFHGHLLDEPELKGMRVRIVVMVEKLLASRAKYLVTVGERVAKELLDAGIGKKSQYLSIAPGVKPLRLADRQSARSELGIAEIERPIVSWLARVVAVKRPNRLLELARSIPEAHFLLAGGGDLLEEVKIDAPANLSVLGWREASSIWAVSDLAVSTSENEGMPVALIEAQLAGIPVVAMNVGGVAEVIEHEVTGFVFDQFDSKFADSVRLLIRDSQLRISMGNNAASRATSHFSIERFTQDHLRLIELVRN